MISIDLRDDHLIENVKAVRNLQKSGQFSEVEIQKLYDKQVEADSKHLPVFMDGVCPKCGRMCGNGGVGPLRCECGWSGEPSQEVEDTIKRFLANKATTPEVCIGVDFASGHDSTVYCRKPEAANGE